MEEFVYCQGPTDLRVVQPSRSSKEGEKSTSNIRSDAGTYGAHSLFRGKSVDTQNPKFQFTEMVDGKV